MKIIKIEQGTPENFDDFPEKTTWGRFKQENERKQIKSSIFNQLILLISYFFTWSQSEPTTRHTIIKIQQYLKKRLKSFFENN